MCHQKELFQGVTIPKQLKEHTLKDFWQEHKKNLSPILRGKDIFVDLKNCTLMLRALASQIYDRLTMLPSHRKLTKVDKS